MFLFFIQEAFVTPFLHQSANIFRWNNNQTYYTSNHHDCTIKSRKCTIQKPLVMFSLLMLSCKVMWLRSHMTPTHENAFTTITNTYAYSTLLRPILDITVNINALTTLLHSLLLKLYFFSSVMVSVSSFFCSAWRNGVMKHGGRCTLKYLLHDWALQCFL